MTQNLKNRIVCTLAEFLLASASISAAGQTLLDSKFTYQGSLKQAGAAFDGMADFDFSLWDAAAGGNQIGSPILLAGVPVIDGLFTAELDFGVDALNGDQRWLEITVGASVLSPRQQLTGAPYALALRGFRTTESDDIGFPDSWNVIGGHRVNSVGAGVAGATISGGGASGFAKNIVSANFGSIGGGRAPLKTTERLKNWRQKTMNCESG